MWAVIILVTKKISFRIKIFSQKPLFPIPVGVKKGNTWEEINKGTTVKEGNVIRTGYRSRAVIELDDGSALRLDQGTEIELSAITGEVIMVSQNSGRVYHRVQKGKIVYNVKSLDTVATALGTSFSVKTDAKEQKTEVAVFESKVVLATSGENTPKTEVKQGEIAVVEKNKKVTLAEIPQEKLKEDFIKWNQTLDKEPTPTKQPTPLPTKTEPTPKPIESKPAVSTSRLTLIAQAKEGAVYLSWSGVESPGGYKLVKSIIQIPLTLKMTGSMLGLLIAISSGPTLILVPPTISVLEYIVKGKS